MKGLILSILIFLIFSLAEGSPAIAQTGDLVVAIDRPGEGEHLYAGPKTLLYSIPIAGWVQSTKYNYKKISLRLEIYQGDEILIETPLRLDSDNLFSIHATVNPKSTFDPFAPLHGVNCDACHHAGTIDLAPGHLKIRIIARDPMGREASAERNIVVDLSSYTTIPVQLEMVGDSQVPLSGIPITASARLYLWRTRTSSNLTDENGFTEIKVEALSEAQTHYYLKVEPTEINGVVYESIAPIEVILSPGVLHIAPVTLQVMAKMGAIHGHLIFQGNMPEIIWAIDHNSGAMYMADVTSEGNFIFTNLPFSEYIIIVNCESVRNEEGTCVQENVFLSNTETPEIQLSIKPSDLKPIQLEFNDEDNHLIPFVWVEVEGQNQFVATRPDSGIATLLLPSINDPITISMLSPGSQSQTLEITPSELGSTIEIELEPDPDIKSVVWSEGRISLPSETNATFDGNQIQFVSGWIWGQGGDGASLIIEAPEGFIALDGGRFALEKQPDQSSWLFLMEGEAEVTLHSGRRWSIHSGEMLSLGEENFQGSVPMNNLALTVIRSSELPSELSILKEPDTGSPTHLTATQVIRMVILILIIGFVLLLFYPWIRRVQYWLFETLGVQKSEEKESKKNE